MAKVPTTGQIRMTDLRLARNVDGTAGTTSNTYSVLRNGANFNLFDPTYLAGATQLSQVNRFSQWRNYPIVTPTMYEVNTNIPNNFITTGFAQSNTGYVARSMASPTTTNGTIRVTTNFSTWSDYNFNFGLRDIIFTTQNYTRAGGSNNRWFLSCGQVGNIIISLASGSQWFTVTTPTTLTLFGAVEMAAGFARIVCVGNSGRIIYNGTLSEISNNWLTATSNTSNNLRDVTIDINRNLLVAVGENRTIVYSTNGTTWTNATIPAPIAWSAGQSVTVTSNGVFLAVDTLGRVIQSSDAINWTFHSTIPLDFLGEVVRIRNISGVIHATTLIGTNNPIGASFQAYLNNTWVSYIIRDASGNIVSPNPNLYGLGEILPFFNYPKATLAGAFAGTMYASFPT